MNETAALRSAVLDATLDALVTIDTEDRIVEFNANAERLFGYQREAVLGKRMADLIIPEHLRAAHLAGMRHYLRHGEGPLLGQRIEVLALRANGATVPVELTVQPMAVNGRTLFTAFIRDISERKRVEDELIRAREKAESASVAKSRFLAHMSHEIRSPLNAVLGATQLLLDGELSREQKNYARTAECSGETLLSLINDLLDFSKIEAGEMSLVVSDFDIGDIVSETAYQAAFKAVNKAVTVAASVSPQVPGLLRGDKTRIRQVLVNLMDNAVKFTETGAVVLQVSTTVCTAEECNLCIRVHDSGIGISSGDQERLFEEFAQADSSDSTDYGGTGLGLSICRGLVRTMGGEITLRSKPHEGSCFEVKLALPVVEQDTTESRSLLPEGEVRLLLLGFHPLIKELIEAHCPQWRCASGQPGHLHFDNEAPFAPYDLTLVNGLSDECDHERLTDPRYKQYLGKMCLLLSNLETHSLPDCAHLYDDILSQPLLVRKLRSRLLDGHCHTGRHTAVGADHELGDPGVDKVRILLAEDSPANQMIARAMLEKAGYRIDVVEDGQQAVKAVQSGEFDLVLMDLRMPRMDGLEATALIRQLASDRSIPIIAMTANASTEDYHRCMAAGMTDFVAKPIERAKLLDTLARYTSADTDEREAVYPKIMDSTLEYSQRWQDYALIDRQAIVELERDTAPEVVPEMLITFVKEIHDRCNQLLRNLDSCRYHSVEGEAHTIKSCSGTFGARRMQAIAEQIERDTREGRYPALASLAIELEQARVATLQAYSNAFDYLSDEVETLDGQQEQH